MTEIQKPDQQASGGEKSTPEKDNPPKEAKEAKKPTLILEICAGAEACQVEVDTKAPYEFNIPRKDPPMLANPDAVVRGPERGGR